MLMDVIDFGLVHPFL